MSHDESTPRDEGAALATAIVFVTVIGLLLAGALSFGAVSLKAASTKYNPARDRLYAADAATKAEVLYLAANPVLGQSLPGVSCRAATTYGNVRGDTVAVKVCPQGVGASGSFPTPGSVRWGLVTLATGATAGVTVTGSNPFRVNGNVYSNSAINSGTGSLVVRQGSLYASSCTGTVAVDGVKDCASAGQGTAKNPGYLPKASANLNDTLPTAAIVGASGSQCVGATTAAKVVTVTPGKWTQTLVTALNTLGCANWYLQPGFHYLENVSWTITKKVVAGALPASGATGISASAVPGGCDDTKSGAMLYLAGTSAITVTGGSLQVCGLDVPQAGGRTVKIPLYDSANDVGGAAVEVSLASTVDATVTGGCAANGPSRRPHGPHLVADGGGSACWQNPGRGTTVDGQYTQHTNITKGSSTSELTVQGFTTSGGAAIPSSVTSLTVNVTGVSTLSGTGGASASYVVKVLNSDGNEACQSTSKSMATGASLPSSPDTFTVTCSKALSAPLRVRFQATAGEDNGTRIIKLDGITMSLNYTATATLKAHTAATAITATTSSAPVWFGGEIYLPASSLALRATALTGAVSTLGAVVKSLTFNADSATVDELGSANNVYTAGGDVLVTTQVGAKDWVTCRVTYTLSGSTGTPSLLGCTVPR